MTIEVSVPGQTRTDRASAPPPRERRPDTASPSLAQVLDRLVVEGELYERLDGNKVRCFACGHRCLILDGLRGICKVRYNRGGTLYVPHGYIGALQCDPTEKKPFFHVYPGSNTLTFGTLGCDFHCSYCQNHVTSQALRDPASGVAPTQVTPSEMVALGRRLGAKLIGSSYNEPLITAEWAVSIFKPAKEAGFPCVFISNGNATRDALEYLRPWLVAYKVDLKSMRDKNYRLLGGKLDNVLATVDMLHELGFWLEIVTLVVPAFNDSDEELRDAAQFLAGISRDIPWHVTAFHQDYKMTENENTPPSTLIRAAEIGVQAGLRYVYAGNLPGRVGPYEHTYCPQCSTPVIERWGFHILQYRLRPGGACPQCGYKLPGVWWEGAPQITSDGFVHPLLLR